MRRPRAPRPTEAHTTRALTLRLGVGLGLGVCAAALAGCQPAVESTAPPKTVVALFDPAASPPVAPTPNDLARDPATGLLAIPDAPGASPAQLELNAYLRTLDGFPPETPATAAFSDAIDPSTVKPANAQLAPPASVLVVDATAMQPLTADDFDLVVGGDKKTITIVPHLPLGGQPAKQPWKLGHGYLVLVFGGADGVRAADPSAQVVASPTTFFLRSARPLLTSCPDDDPKLEAPACLCPQSGGLYASGCHPAAGLTTAQAAQLEPLRQKLAAALALLLPVAGKQREDLVLAWQFTIAHGPFAAFDATGGRVPFPNDVLLDPTTGLVNLPFDPKSPEAPIYRGLNTLDGFSTTANVTIPIDAADDNAGAPPKNLTPGQSALLVDASMPAQPEFTAQPELVNGGRDWDGLLLLTPRHPLLPDKTEYLGALTSDVTDAKGRPLRPSVTMKLIESDAPLTDAGGHTTLPGTLTDDQAAPLEAIRQGYVKAGVWAGLAAAGVAKEKVAAIFTFRTQTETKPLADLAAAAQMLPTDVTILDAEPSSGALGPDVGQLVFGTMRSHVALTMGGAPGAVLDPSGGRDVDVPFLLIAPSSGQAKGVAIVQHGFGRWRGDIRNIAEAFAKAGWAIVGIDINFHGQRTACMKDADCAGGTCMMNGACSTKLAVKCTADSQCAGDKAGSCDTKSGACANGFAPNSSLCMTHLEKGAPVTECNPTASGGAFLDVQNPFAVRDNLRQHVLDLAQLERVVTADGQGSLKAQLAALDPIILVDNTRTAYVGQSLGGIEGGLFLAVAQRPDVGVLDVPGGRLVDLLVQSQTFSPLLTPELSALSVPTDSPPYYRLLDTFRWIVDPGDPINFARYLVRAPLGGNMAKPVLVQEAGKDMVVPNAETDALAVEIGLPFVDGHPGVTAVPASMPMAPAQPISTYFASASHGFLFSGEASTPSGQAQAVSFVDSAGLSTTPPGM